MTYHFGHAESDELSADLFSYLGLSSVMFTWWSSHVLYHVNLSYTTHNSHFLILAE